MPPGRALPLQIRQVAARRKLSLPTLEHERPRAITWRRPTYRMVLSMVHSPFYAGAYAFGRRESRTRSEVPVALPRMGVNVADAPTSRRRRTLHRETGGYPRTRPSGVLGQYGFA